MIVKLSTAMVDTAWIRFCIYYDLSIGRRKGQTSELFWRWLGTNSQSTYAPLEDRWHMKPDQAKKIEMLNSPYWMTLMKAYEVKYRQIADG